MLVVAPWLRVVFEWERRDAAARLSTPELRLAVAQAFLCRGQGSGVISSTWDRSVAERLAACSTSYELWPLFDRSARAGMATNVVARIGEPAPMLMVPPAGGSWTDPAHPPRWGPRRPSWH